MLGLSSLRAPVKFSSSHFAWTTTLALSHRFDRPGHSGVTLSQCALSNAECVSWSLLLLSSGVEFKSRSFIKSISSTKNRWGEFRWTWKARGPSSTWDTLPDYCLCLGVVQLKSPQTSKQPSVQERWWFSLSVDQAISPLVCEIWDWKYMPAFISKDSYLMFLTVTEYPLPKGCHRGWKHDSSSAHFRGGTPGFKPVPPHICACERLPPDAHYETSDTILA